MKRITTLCQSCLCKDSSLLTSGRRFSCIPNSESNSRLNGRMINLWNSVKSRNNRLKHIGVGCGIGMTLLGASLLDHVINPEFKKYRIPTHGGNPDCRTEFEKQFGSFLRQYNGKPWVIGIMAANALVFLGWRFGNIDFMTRHFLCSFDNIAAKRYERIFINWKPIFA